MNYQELRAQAQDGDIIFLEVDPTNWLSQLTARTTGSKLTHAAFVFWYQGRLLVAEATTQGGTRIAVASHYANRQFRRVPAPRQWTILAPQALGASGTAKYGWISAAYIGLRHWLLTHTGLKLPQITGNRARACSEYVADLLGFIDSDISPEQLYQQLQAPL